MASESHSQALRGQRPTPLDIPLANRSLQQTVLGSKFSPDTPPRVLRPERPPRPAPRSFRFPTVGPTVAHRHDPEQGVPTFPAQGNGFTDGLARKMLGILPGNARPPQVVPIPLTIGPGRPREKRHSDHGRWRRRVEFDWRRRLWLILVGLLTIALLVDTIYLNTRVSVLQSLLNPDRNENTTSITSTSISLSADAQQCLAQFATAAPADPIAYPASTCLPALLSVPSGYVTSYPEEARRISDAIQFGAIKAVFDASDVPAQACMRSWGWMNDVRVCSWGKVECDLNGQITSL